MSRSAAVWLGAITLMGIAFALFAYQLGHPRSLIFDEQHYVPAAKELLHFLPNRNYEHPPLAKLLIGITIAALGDHAVGWRAASAVAGAVGVGTVIWMTFGFYRNVATALLAGWLALASGLLFTMSRLAMLDVFACTASFMGVAAALCGRPLISSIAIGVAISCKWSALPVWGLLLLGYPLYYGGERLREKTQRLPILFLTFTPIAVYILSYLPLLFVKAPGHDLFSLLQMQMAMWQAQVQKVALHTAHLPWWRWPFKLEPWTLAQELTPDGHQYAALMQGNPVVILGGFVAMIVISLRAVQRRERGDVALTGLFAAVYLVWAFSPRSNHFYHYFLPGSITLAVALARAVTLVVAAHKPTYKWALYALVAAAASAWLLMHVNAMVAA